MNKVSCSCLNNFTVFNASATSLRALTVKWQRKGRNDADFTDVTTAVAYTSGSVSSYKTANLLNSDDGAQYRAVFTSNCNENPVNITSAAAQLSVTNCSPIGLRPFPEKLPACLYDAFRNLEKVYNTSNGTNWKHGADQAKKDAWFTDNMANWYGITLTPDGCDVLYIDLGSNLNKKAPDGYEFIVGLPQSFNGTLNQLNFPKLERFDLSNNGIQFQIFDYFLPNLKTLNLSNNKLITAIPNLKDCPNLQKLLLNNNQLDGNIPDFSQLKLDTIDVSSNRFVFGDLAKKNWLSKPFIKYAPQAIIPLINFRSVSVETGEPDLVQKFSWFRIGTNRDTVLVATTSSHIFAPSISGVYFCQIIHDALTLPNNPNRNLILKTVNAEVVLPATLQESSFSNQISGISIFPNPANETVTVAFECKDAKYCVSTIRIVDLLGREMDKRFVNSPSTDFDISQYSTGVYLIEINFNGENFVKKLVKE